MTKLNLLINFLLTFITDQNVRERSFTVYVSVSPHSDNNDRYVYIMLSAALFAAIGKDALENFVRHNLSIGAFRTYVTEHNVELRFNAGILADIMTDLRTPAPDDPFAPRPVLDGCDDHKQFGINCNDAETLKGLFRLMRALSDDSGFVNWASRVKEVTISDYDEGLTPLDRAQYVAHLCDDVFAVHGVNR